MENRNKTLYCLKIASIRLCKAIAFVSAALATYLLKIYFDYIVLHDNSRFGALKNRLTELGGEGSILTVVMIFINTVIAPGFVAGLPFIVFFGFLILLVYLVEGASRLSSGTKAYKEYTDRISIFSLLSMLNPFRHLRVYRLIHEFHHEYKRNIKLINQGVGSVTSVDNGIVVDSVERMLIRIKEVADTLLDDDVAVHIKLFEKKGHAKVKYPTKNLIKQLKLSTYIRIPSCIEAEKRKKGILTTRQDNEKFVTFVEDYENTNKFIETIKNNYPKDSPLKALRINSGYLYAFQPNEHYYICNDLALAEKKCCFWSNSNNYTSYYNSLAVFLIFPPCIPGAFLESFKEAPYGLLVFDSLSKGKFDSIRLKTVGGLLAHKMNDFFENILK